MTGKFSRVESCRISSNESGKPAPRTRKATCSRAIDSTTKSRRAVLCSSQSLWSFFLHPGNLALLVARNRYRIDKSARVISGTWPWRTEVEYFLTARVILDERRTSKTRGESTHTSHSVGCPGRTETKLSALGGESSRRAKRGAGVRRSALVAESFHGGEFVRGVVVRKVWSRIFTYHMEFRMISRQWKCYRPAFCWVSKAMLSGECRFDCFCLFCFILDSFCFYSYSGWFAWAIPYQIIRRIASIVSTYF